MSTVKSKDGNEEKGLSTDSLNYFQVVGFVDEDGVANPYKNIDGKPRVSTTPYLYDISEGNVPGHVPRSMQGRNDDVSTVLEDLTLLPTGVIPLLSSAIPMEIVSTSASDSLGGSGVNSVEVHYLDSDWNEVDDVLELNGLTPVSLSVPAIRINSVHSHLVGAVQKAVGNITVQSVGGAVGYHILALGDTNSFPGIFSVPAGKRAFVVSWGWGAGKGKETEIRLTGNFDPYEGNMTDGAYNVHDVKTAISRSDSRPFLLPKVVPEKADIILKAIVTDTGTVTANGSVEFWVE